MKFINRPPRATFASILRVLGSSDLPLLFFFFSLSERASALLTIIIIIVKLGLQKRRFLRLLLGRVARLN